MSRSTALALRWALVLTLLLALALAGLLAWQLRPPPWTNAPAPGAAAGAAAGAVAGAVAGAEPPVSAELLLSGAMLARAGHCAGCHTERGGAAYAGGRAIPTPFGELRSPNLTPDAATGLGNWRETDFRRALQQGQSRDGRLLLPACPYPSFTRVSDDDVQALWAWLRSQPPVAQAPQPHALAWPYNTQLAIALWRSLYFRPGRFEPDATRSEQANRGAYLVNGLGHCDACHGRRGLLGNSAALGAEGSTGGAVMPDQRWYAPSLTDAAEGGVPGRDADELVQLLKTGVSPRATVMGPMAEVVAGSTQHLAESDLRAMVAYLQQLPATPPVAVRARAQRRDAEPLQRGRQLYQDLCTDCHGDQGQGAPGIYPPLAGNPTVTMADSRNLLQSIRRGGFPPATAGNPRPYGMPSFDLPDADLAALASWLRAAWGHDAAPVQAVQVLLAR